VIENVSINWARDLPASARNAIEKLLGRSLLTVFKVALVGDDRTWKQNWFVKRGSRGGNLEDEFG
jgi:hypothetical protein